MNPRHLQPMPFKSICFKLVPLLLAMTVLGACSKTEDSAPAKKMAEVGFVTVAPQRLPISTTLQGRTTAFLTADIRPQITGIIESRLFKEGADVRQGDILYQIDPATYQAAWDGARAALVRVEATLRASQVKAERYVELLKIDAVSQQDNDDVQNALNENKANVEVARAAVKTARINLDFTKIKSPISGRIETSVVTPGTLVVAQQSAALTTVQKIDPIFVDVTQSSTELLRLRKELAAGNIKKSGKDTAVVNITLEDGTAYSLPGRLTFSGISVNTGTGMVTLRAEVPNPEGVLLPGIFVRAAIEEGFNDNAILIPQRAVTRDVTGNATALILNGENEVAQRTLVIAGAVGNQWLIGGGLEVGDRVIVDGLQNVKVGDIARGVDMTKILVNVSADAAGLVAQSGGGIGR
ncbi:efflux RND transporter periplasmic adaptor subunit [Glaciimonas immobilis]|nr:efflux RND transporter periplasmic adaptor subunit [Glaciimonas immobilis]